MDIYFRKEYGCLYEEAEGGVCETFDFDDPLGHVRHMFIKRQIKAAPGFYDLVTPYGYGGPLITQCPEERIHYVPGKAVGNASSGKAMGNAVPGRAEGDAARGRTAGNTSPDKAAEDSPSGRAEGDAASDMTAENRDCEDTGSPDRRPGSEREYPGRKALSAAFGQAFSEYCR
ncbi:MAG: hypothetical protein K6E33_04635, partial [Lachnospiraceae bacterium]|nr:hypothetical protein [Lachnospiraceae bacterium]